MSWKSFLTFLFFVLVCALVPAERGAAQWVQLKQFNSEPRVIYFLDLPGPPRIGFIGTQNGSVWRTSDGGMNWSPIVPITLGQPTVAFAFKDSLTGWYCTKAEYIDPLTGITKPTFVFKTTDGGFTWNATGAMYQNYTALEYRPETGKLFVSTWSDTMLVSTDEGASFSFLTDGNFNGYAFLNGTDGIVSHLGTNPPNVGVVTHDAGRSWQLNDMPDECWQPLAIKGGTSYFAVGEHFGAVLRSDNKGDNWRRLPAKLPSLPTGDIKGDLCGLIIQTNDNGMMLSTDEGATWNEINGPSELFDLRFYVKGDYIYANDTKTLWRTSLSLIRRSSAIVVPEKLEISQPACVPVDSVIRFQYIHSCISSTSSLTEATLVGSPNISLVNVPNFPRSVFSKDSLVIRFNSATRSTDTAFLHLKFVALDSSFDTTVMIVGTSVLDNPKEWTLLPKDTLQLSASNCFAHDTMLSFTYRDTCSRAILSGIELEGSPNFQLLDTTTTPYLLNKKNSFKLRLLPSGNDVDTATIRFHFLANGIPVDTSITVYGFSHNGQPKAWTALPIDSILTTAFDCQGIDTAIYFSYKDSCSRATLRSIRLSDNTHFQITQGIDLPHLVDSTNKIAIHYQPSGDKADSTAITLQFDVNGFVYDTTISLKVRNQYARLSEWTQLPPDTVRMFATACLPADTLLLLHATSLCLQAVLETVDTADFNDFIVVNRGALPRVIVSTDSLHIRFLPQKFGTIESKINLSVSGNGESISKTIVLIGNLTNDTILRKPEVTPLSANLQSESCSYVDTVIHYGYTIPCSEATLIGAEIVGSNAFVVDPTLSLPQAVGFRDSVSIRYIPQGLSSDQATLHLKFLVDGVPVDTVLSLRGSVSDIFHLQWPTLLTDQGVKREQDSLGALVGFTVRTSQDIPQSIHLDSLQMQLSFNDNVLDLRRLYTSPAWQITDSSVMRGVMNLVLHRTAQGDLAKDSVILGAKFATYVSDSNYSTVDLSHVVFNNLDTVTRGPCVIDQPDEVLYELLPECSDSVLQYFMRGEPLIDLMTVIPNPAEHAQHVTVHLHLAQEGEIIVRLIDMLGNEKLKVDVGRLEKGEQSVPLDISHIPSGAYLLTVQNPSIIISSKITIK